MEVADMQLMKDDGGDYVPATKTDVRKWAQRIREGLREIDRAIANDDVESLVGFAHDVSGSAGEIENIADATQECAS